MNDDEIIELGRLLRKAIDHNVIYFWPYPDQPAAKISIDVVMELENEGTIDITTEVYDEWMKTQPPL